jgi:hypothetical protein
MKRDTRRAPGRKPAGPVGDVKLGCSFFEKWVFRLKVRRISRRRQAPHGARTSKRPPPRPRALDGAQRRGRRNGAARRGSSCFSQPNSDAGGGSTRRSERWARRFECPAPHPSTRCGRRVFWAVGFDGSLRGSFQPPSSSGATAGGARLADMRRQRSETPGGLSQPTAQKVLHARGAWRHVRALTGKT